MADHDEASKLVLDWFVDLLETSGRKNNKIAEILDLSNSAISRIKSGNQALKADQMIILSEALNHPLPATGKTAGKAPATLTPASFPRELFDKAYQQVADIEKLRPEHERMDTYAMLDTVFYVMQTMLQESKTN